MSDFLFLRGTDRNFVLTWKQGTTPMNITGATITVNFKINATDATALLTKDTTVGGVSLTNPTSGEATVLMDEADFGTLQDEQELVMGIKMTLSGRTYGAIKTVNVVPIP